MANQKTAKKAGPLWVVSASGTLLSAAIWLAGTLALAGAMALGVGAESGSFPILAAITVISALIGGGYALRGGGFVPALAAAGGFALLLLIAGFLLWSRFGWIGHGGILLLSALAGGACAGLMGGGGKRKKSKRRMR